MAIDYRSIIQKITHGVGTAAHDIIPPVAVGYTENALYAYDPAAANRMLDEAGWKIGPDGVRAKGSQRLDWVIHISAGSAGSRMIATYLQPLFKAIGANLTIKTYPYSVLFSHEGPIYGEKYDLATYSLTLSYDPDNLFYLGCDYWFPSGENVYGYCDRKVDAAEKAGLQTDDPAERARIYAAAQKRIHATVPWIPLYNARRPVVRNPDLRNFRPAPTSTPWWNAWEWDI
jgi:peptide/nickel transport system substrate-binding protein